MEETLNTSVNEETQVAEATEQTQEKLYTAAEIQSIVDKRVTQAVQTV